MEFLETLLSGLSSGGTYAMIALGYTMVYGIAKMLNFAHGDVIMVGGYTLYVVFTSIMAQFAGAAPSPVMALLIPLLALLVAVVFCAVLGVTIEKLAYKPLRGASPLAVLITAIGMSYLLQAAAQMIFGSANKQFRLYDLGVIPIGSFQLSVYTLITLAASAVIMVGLSLFVKFTRVGRAMIAVSEDKGAAQLMGINVNFIITITFAIGSALAAFAGFFMVLKPLPVNNTLGAMPGIKAFTAAVIGGIGSIPGAMLGGILMGVVEAFCQTSPVLAPFTEAIEFGILIVILLVRPSGLLGKKRREKV